MINPVPKHDVVLAEDGSGYLHGGILWPRLTHLYGEFFPYLGPPDDGRGAYVHSCFEALIDDDLDLVVVSLSPYVGYVDALLRFIEDRFIDEPRFLAREISLWHPWGYGTTIDSVAMLSEERGIIELKTGTMEHVSLQLGGQSIAWNENFPDRPVTRGYCLKANSDGTYKLHQHNLDVAQADFAAVMRLYDYQRRRKIGGN